MTNYDVIKKLLGPIAPQGETRTDEERYENLEATIELLNQLIGDVITVSHNKTRQEHSMKEAGLKAEAFLIELVDGIAYWFPDSTTIKSYFDAKVQQRIEEDADKPRSVVKSSPSDVLHSASFMETSELNMAKKLHENMEKLAYTAQPGSTLDIIWNKTDWVCTDPDNQQYGRRLYTGAYEFKEWDRNTHVLANVDIGSEEDLKWKKENFDNENFWIRETIILSKYPIKEQEHIINSYAYTFEDGKNKNPNFQNIKELYPDNWEWIVAECIFEVESELY